MISKTCSLLFILLFISIIYIINQKNNNLVGGNNDNNINKDLNYLLEKTNYGKFIDIEKDISNDNLFYNFTILFKNNNGNYFNLFDKYDKLKGEKIMNHLIKNNNLFNIHIKESIEKQISDELNVSSINFTEFPSKFIAGSSSIGLNYDLKIFIPKSVSLEQLSIKLDKSIENNLIKSIHSSLFDKYVDTRFSKFVKGNGVIEFSLMYKLKNIDLINLENIYSIDSLNIMKNDKDCIKNKNTLCKKGNDFTYYNNESVGSLLSANNSLFYYNHKFYKIQDNKLKQIDMLFDTSIIKNIEDSIKNYIINKLSDIYLPKSNIKFNFRKRSSGKDFGYSDYFEVIIEAFSDNQIKLEDNCKELLNNLSKEYLKFNFDDEPPIMLFNSILFCSNKIESYYKDIYLKTNNNFKNQQELYIDKIVFDNKMIESYEIYNNNIPLPVKNSINTGNTIKIGNISFYFKNNYKIEKISEKTKTKTVDIKDKLNDNGTIITNFEINKNNKYFITIVKDNDSNKIEYNLDFTDTKYYKENDITKINCSDSDYYQNYILNNKDDLLNKLDCSDSYIKDIKKNDNNKKIYSVFDDNNNFQRAYIYSNEELNDDYKLCDNDKCPDIFTSENKIKINNEKDLLQIKHNLESYKIPKRTVYKALGELFKKNNLNINILESFINRLKRDENFEYIKDLVDGRTLEYCLDNSLSLKDLYSTLKDISELKINAALYYLSIYKNSKYKKDLVENSLLVEKNNKTEIPLFIEVFRYMSLEQKRLYINNKKNSNKVGVDEELINFLLKVQLSIHHDTNSYLQNHKIKKTEISDIDNLISEDEIFKQKYWISFTKKYLEDINYLNFYKSYYILLDNTSKIKEENYCNLLLKEIRKSSKQPIETLLDMAKSKNTIYEKCINNKSLSIPDLISKIKEKYNIDDWKNNTKTSEEYSKKILNLSGKNTSSNNEILVTTVLGGNPNSMKYKLLDHIKTHKNNSEKQLEHYKKKLIIVEEENSDYNKHWIEHDIYHKDLKKVNDDFHNTKSYEQYKNKSNDVNNSLKLNKELFNLINDTNKKEIINIYNKFNKNRVIKNDILQKIDKVLEFEKNNDSYILTINKLCLYFYSLVKYKKYNKERGNNDDLKYIINIINTTHIDTLKLFDDLIKLYNIIINENIRNNLNSTLIYALFNEIKQIDIIKNNIDTLVKKVNSKYSHFEIENSMTGGTVLLNEVKYKILFDSYFLNKINKSKNNKNIISELIKKHPNDFNRYVIYNYKIKNNFNIYKEFFIDDLNKLLNLKSMLESNNPLYDDISLIINNINNIEKEKNTKNIKKINVDDSIEKKKYNDSKDVEIELNKSSLKEKNNKIKTLEDKIDNLKNNILVQQNSINLREINLKKQTQQILSANKVEKKPVKQQDVINYLIKDKNIVKEKKYILELDSQNNINFKSTNQQLDFDIADKEKEINAISITDSDKSDLFKIRNFIINQKQLEIKRIEDNKIKENIKQVENNTKKNLEEDNKLKSDYEKMKKKHSIILQEYNELQSSYKNIKNTINKAVEFDLTLNIPNINSENKAAVIKSIANKFNIPVTNLYLKKIENSNLVGGSSNKKISIIIYNQPINNIITKINNLITSLSNGDEIKLGNFKVLSVNTPKNINLSKFQIESIKANFNRPKIITNNPVSSTTSTSTTSPPLASTTESPTTTKPPPTSASAATTTTAPVTTTTAPVTTTTAPVTTTTAPVATTTTTASSATTTASSATTTTAPVATTTAPVATTTAPVATTTAPVATTTATVTAPSTTITPATTIAPSIIITPSVTTPGTGKMTAQSVTTPGTGKMIAQSVITPGTGKMIAQPVTTKDVGATSEISLEMNKMDDSVVLLNKRSENNQIKLNNTQLELDKTNETIKNQNKKLKEIEKLLLKYKRDNNKDKVKQVEDKKKILIKKQKNVIDNKQILEDNKDILKEKQTLINEEKTNVEQKTELNSQESYIKQQLEKQEKLLEKQKVNETKKTEELTNQQDELNIGQQKEMNNMIKEEKKESLEEENKNKIETIKNNNECRLKRYDCLANNKDIYTMYKKDYKYLNNWSFDVTDNDKSLYDKSSDSKCGLNNDCSVCPMLSSGIPNSVDLSKKDKIISKCKSESCNDCFYDKNYIEYKNAYDKNKLKKYKKGYK